MRQGRGECMFAVRKTDRTGSRDHIWLWTVALLALEDQADRFSPGPFDANDHGAIRGQAVAFDSNRTGLSGGHLQDVVIPAGLALEVFAGVNGGVVLAVGDVVVVKRLGGAFIHETARDDNDALPIGNRHSAGLNDGLAGEVALGGYQGPGAIERAVVSREGGESAEQGREGDSGNCSC